MKTKAVHFDSEGYARIRINPDAEFLALPNTLKDPDLSAVDGVPPEYWALKEGKIIPMTHDEWVARDAELNSEHAPTRGHIIRVPAPIEKKVYVAGPETIVLHVPLWAATVMAAETSALVLDLIFRFWGHL